MRGRRWNGRAAPHQPPNDLVRAGCVRSRWQARWSRAAARVCERACGLSLARLGGGGSRERPSSTKLQLARLQSHSPAFSLWPRRPNALEQTTTRLTNALAMDRIEICSPRRKTFAPKLLSFSVLTLRSAGTSAQSELVARAPMRYDGLAQCERKRTRMR